MKKTPPFLLYNIINIIKKALYKSAITCVLTTDLQDRRRGSSCPLLGKQYDASCQVLKKKGRKIKYVRKNT